MRRALLLIAAAAGMVLLPSCTTLENRADLYSPRNYYANGPYTRMLHGGIPRVTRVFVQTSVRRSDDLYIRGK